MAEPETYRLPAKRGWWNEPEGQRWAEVTRAAGAGWTVRETRDGGVTFQYERCASSLLSVRRTLRGSYDLKALPEPNHTRAQLCHELTSAVITWWARNGDYLVFPEIAVGGDVRPKTDVDSQFSPFVADLQERLRDPSISDEDRRHFERTLDRLQGPPQILRRVDVLAVGIWSRTDYRRLVFEVKVDRSDWTAELRSPEKRRAAMAVAHEFWFVVPQGLVKPDEVPEGTGLLEYRPTQASPFKKLVPAPVNQDAELTAEFAARLLMRASNSVVLRNRGRPSLFPHGDPLAEEVAARA